MELGLCIEAVDKLARLWDTSDDEDKQGLARSLFTQITYDLVPSGLLTSNSSRGQIGFSCCGLPCMTIRIERMMTVKEAAAAVRGMICCRSPYGAKLL